MKKIFLFTLIYIFSCFSAIEIHAIRATPYPITISQPDGSKITIRLHGDERFHFETTTDGYLILPNKKGFLCYATLDSTGKFVNTEVRAKDVSQRTQSDDKFLSTISKHPNLFSLKTSTLYKTSPSRISNSSQFTVKRGYPTTGSPKALVILVSFSDNNFTVSDPKTAFTNLLNQHGYSTNGGTGSAKDYFEAASDSVFKPQFDVVGPYKLPHNIAYYGANDANGDDTNPRQMVIDACTLAYQNGVNFANYDTDGDGYVDNVFIYYAGFNEAEGGGANTIWPHRWTLANTSTTFDGKIVYDYACTSELRGAKTTTPTSSLMCGIGTFCHEFGHVLGLVDYYPTNGGTQHTLSYWNIMDAGAYLNYGRTPPTYSAYDRFYLGWLTPIELKSPKDVTLPPIETSNKAYIITRYGNSNLDGANPSPVEFFTLEDRQKTGWDQYLPGHGMLITHIYYNASDWSNNIANNDPSAMGVDIVEADGSASDNTLPGDPFPGTSNVTSYRPVLRDGTDIGKPLTDIKETNGIITFKFMGGGNSPQTSTISNLSQFSTVQGTPSTPQLIKVYGNTLVSDVKLAFSGNVNYEIRKENATDSVWSKSITLSPVDSVLDTTNILIRYYPVQPSFRNIDKDTLNITATNAETNYIIVKGQSTRPVYVIPPVANTPSKITSNAFVANWDTVYDASGYYLTVYSKTPFSSSIHQGFDNGLTAPTGWTISANQIDSSSIFSGDSIPAIEFTNTGDYIQTQQYIEPPVGYSFYVKSMAENTGKLAFDALADSGWVNIDTIPVTSTMQGTQTISLNPDDNYSRFKLSFIKGTGDVAIDDMSALYDSTFNYVVNNNWVSTNIDTVIDLIPETNYYYKVKASDRTLYSDSTIKYENITNFSNLIKLTTKKDSTNNLLRVNKLSDGRVAVMLQNPDQTIYVYNVLGQLVRTVNANSNLVYLYGLPPNQVYILKAGNRKAVIIY